MTAETATEDIIYLVYEAAIISPDPIVQETHVETSIRDILEELLESKTVDEDLEYENRRLERENERLEDELAGREADYQDAVEKLRRAQNQIEELASA